MAPPYHRGCLCPQENGANTIGGRGNCSAGAEGSRQAPEERNRNVLPVLKRTPKLAEYVQTYLAHYAKLPDAKRPATIAKECGALTRWAAYMGETRLDRITKAQINVFRGNRQSEGISGRTVNLDVIALNNLFKMAVDDGWLKHLPTENLRPLKWIPKRRRLVSVDEIKKIREAAKTASKNGQQASDYLWLMACAGTRRSETLRLRCEDVDFERGLLRVGWDGLAKYGSLKQVDLNSELEAHLRAMQTRRAPDSQWLFPSPQRGAKDICAKTFKASIRKAAESCGLGDVTNHDCRHSFISYCVMSGIDFMTIARWVGHKDGGVLIGSTYGHLSNDHAKKQAQRVNLGQ